MRRTGAAPWPRPRTCWPTSSSDGVQTVAFARSRAGVEVVAASARRSLAEVDRGLAETVAAYRGGYLPEDRRVLESALREGRLRGLAATNALELGIDVSGLDAVLLAGWPGTLASLWQQAGRAGRAGARSLAVIVAADDPLDTYLVHHPESLFERPVEAAVLDPQNPYVLAPHLAAAAAELPLTEVDVEVFGPTMPALVEALVARGTAAPPTGRVVLDPRGPGGRPRVAARLRRGGAHRGAPHRTRARHRRRHRRPQQRAHRGGLRAPGRDVRRDRARPGRCRRAGHAR